jgi:hypothetical protein
VIRVNDGTEIRLHPIAFARDMVGVYPPLRLLGTERPPKDGLYRVATRNKV